MILGRPFLAIIHARINVFDRKFSLGIREDRIVFYMNGNVHHLIVLIKKVCMINEVQEEESFNPPGIGEDLFSYDSCLCLDFEKYTKLYDSNQEDNDTFVGDMQDERERRSLAYMLPMFEGMQRRRYNLWIDKHGDLKQWYGDNKIDDTTRARRYEEWFSKNNKHRDYGSTSMPYLENYTIAPMEITDPDHQENPILNINSYFSNSSQLANKYELSIGKKGYILNDIWEKCEQVHGGTIYSCHDEGFEEEEQWESGLDEVPTTRSWKFVIILACGFVEISSCRLQLRRNWIPRLRCSWA
ncbi:hypothetical protein Tco_1056381 [Tanacetum coccineum]|uniref:Uncharacterized protein n=1 Tax=Tanacetum coccineum TaxID=301880 RepID=A0ABQ5H377_9ASTR